MPITPTYSWSENPAWVTVEVCLNSMSQAALDIMTTDCYIKVNCSPYFFQADLYDDIDSKKSSAMVDKNVVKFFMFKKTEGIWGRLTRCGDWKATLERRQRSLDAVRDNAQKEKEEAKEKVSHIRRLAVSSQMKLEDTRRKIIEERKQAELQAERDSLNSWQQELSGETISPVPDPKPSLDAATEPIATIKREGVDNLAAESKKIDQEQASAAASTAQDLAPVRTTRLGHARIATLKPGERLLPAPRQSFRVYVAFTKKIHPNHLPARESREKELKLLKHAPDPNDSTDISERVPLFLQDKGDKFYRAGDFRSAINAYSDALRKDGSLVLSRANRAACYLQTCQFRDCIEDCTKALQILTGEDDLVFGEAESKKPSAAVANISLKKDYLPMNTLDLLKSARLDADDSGEWKNATRSCILARRGSAKCHLGDLDDAVADFQQALKLNPSSTDIRTVMDSIAAK